MVGVFDLASNVTEGIRNTTANDTLIDRVRAPRHVGADGILTVSWHYRIIINASTVFTDQE
jgi:hypothetical protein